MSQRVAFLLFFGIMLNVLNIASTQETQQVPLTNQDVIEMFKAGLSAEIVVAKIKGSKGNYDTNPKALQELKAAGVSDAVILVIIEKSSLTQAPPVENKVQSPEPPKRIKDDLTKYFSVLQNSVVTVWSEFGHGTGFIVGKEGLILTNQHVIGPSEYIAVQFDAQRKVKAVLLAADAAKDVAVIWANLEAFSDSLAAPIAKPSVTEPSLSEGERVFTIGSPISQRKIMTTGIASKIEERAIISDININPGNSGGPLFNSVGEVVGLTTFGENTGAGPGISGIVRIEEAIPLLDLARKMIASKKEPEATLLPVEPKGDFPIDAIKESLAVVKFDSRPYLFDMGNYDVAIITPILKYQFQEADRLAAAKTKEKRTKNKAQAVQGTFRPLDDLRNWAEYAGEYRPVIIVRARPKLRETFMSALGRGMARNYGVLAPATLKFKTDFYRMRLSCGDKTIEPIQPGKIAHVLNEKNAFVHVTDATYEGVYSYPFDSIGPSCGKVTLELFSEKDPDKATTKVLDEKTVRRVGEDFDPYRNVRNH